MFRKSAKDNDATELTENQTEPVIKYPDPRILLIDLEDEVEKAISSTGYNVHAGTFGTPYRVKQANEYAPINMNGDLPQHYGESDIVVVDMNPKPTLEKPSDDKSVVEGQLGWWAKCQWGVIDPRPMLMAFSQANLNKILDYGGIFIIFAAPKNPQDLVFGSVERYYGFNKQQEIPYDNWSFLKILDLLSVKSDEGNHVDVIGDLIFSDVFNEFISHKPFNCTIAPKYGDTHWLPLAFNKYGASVAGILAKDNKELSTGFVFILPRPQNISKFLTRFFEETLPEFRPDLFPHHEGGKWVQRPEYELPHILRTYGEIRAIKEEADEKIGILQQRVKQEREEFGWLHQLLSETGDNLVRAVKTALEFMGFEQVVDADEEFENAEDERWKKEDLRIEDNSPWILVEVKGVNGIPKDSEVFQIRKHLFPRSQEFKRHDLKGLTIINHQRHIPALERDEAFNENLRINSEKESIGLLATWDLFRLVRNFIKFDWRHDQIKTLFYQDGLIEIIPSHYQYVGIIEKYWPQKKAVTIQIEAVPIRFGDRIAFEMPVEFEEQTVDSLQRDREAVEIVEVGETAGILTSLTQEMLKKGTRVYIVKTC